MNPYRKFKILRQITERKDMIKFIQAVRKNDENVVNEIMEKYNIKNIE